MVEGHGGTLLWFDVEMIRYTTSLNMLESIRELWFDVEMIRYTTNQVN